MGACIHCGRECIDPHDFPTCEKCHCAGPENPVTVINEETEEVISTCDCRCHMTEEDLEAEAGDIAYSEWKENRED